MPVTASKNAARVHVPLYINKRRTCPRFGVVCRVVGADGSPVVRATVGGGKHGGSRRPRVPVVMYLCTLFRVPSFVASLFDVLNQHFRDFLGRTILDLVKT